MNLVVLLWMRDWFLIEVAPAEYILISPEVVAPVLLIIVLCCFVVYSLCRGDKIKHYE